MKRLSLYTAWLTMLFVFAGSSLIQGAAALEKVVGKAALSGADKALFEAALKGVDEATLNTLAKVESKVMFDGILDAAKALENAGLKAEDTAMSKIMQDSIQTTLKSVENDAAKIEKFTTNLTGVTVEDLSKSLAGKSSQEANTLFTGLQDAGMPMRDVNLLKQDFTYSKSILGKTSTGLKSVGGVAASPFALAADKTAIMTGKADATFLEKLGTRDAEALTNARKVLVDRTATAEARAAATEEIANLEWKASTTGGKVLRTLNAGAGHLPGLAMMVGGTVMMAVMFMIPSIFESAFLAQQAQNAALQTYLPPIKFGNIVMQLPDSVVNMSNPAQSQFVYYGIPVNNPGEKLSDAAKAAYPGVSGPTDKNKLSREVDNGYAQAFTFAKKLSIPRYNLNAQALSTLPIFVSYSSQSWQPWGLNGIPDAAFPQMMIDLRTGYIFYADGTSQGTPPAQLTGIEQNGTTVQSFMSNKLGQLSSASATVSYTQYVNDSKGAKDVSVDTAVINQFNCKCLSQNNGILSASAVNSCSNGKKSSCLLTNVLNQLAAGLVLNAQGTVLQPGQDLQAELAKGALGQIIPIQGYGSQFDSILQLFPGAEQQAVANSGALTIKLGTNMAAAQQTKIQGADPDNYTAKGIYIYQCKNTPLAKMLQNQSGGSAAANQYLTDYIVFLDENLNQVPLMAPKQDPNNYNFITMGLNPAIKYFSTIIGSMSSNGNGGASFNFLPQLNIQAPAALQAKGLPASFTPLYGLQAANGTPAINYNQNLSSVIGGIVQSLLNNPKLGQQFSMMQSVIMQMLASGPFGKYSLTPLPSSMLPSIGGVNLTLYSGMNGYPVPAMDQNNAACTDVLLPISPAGKTVTLPSNNVSQYYGLVTDLVYSVLPDGSIVTNSNSFTNSLLSSSLQIDQTKVSQFYWMNQLATMAQSNDPNFTMPSDLVNFVSQARQAWISFISSIQSNKQEFAGITLPGTSNVVTVVDQQSVQNGLYVYTCAPCPSNLPQDYFVIAQSISTQPNGKMSATKATASSYLVSLVSGNVYTIAGSAAKNSSGSGNQLDASSLVKSLYAANPQAFSASLAGALNIALAQASTINAALNYPIQFGNLQLGIYQADQNNGVFLYVDASGAGSSDNFQPSDYFVTVNSAINPSQIAQQIGSGTQYVASLVTGQVYGASGIVGVLNSSAINGIISKLSSTWRSGVASQIAGLQSDYAASQQDLAQQSNQSDFSDGSDDQGVTWSQSSVAQIISNLGSVNYLPAPYDMLKQDPNSGMYALVSPANADGTEFLYTFFDVPNNMTDINGNPMHIAVSYDGQANQIKIISGATLAGMMQQYGIVIDNSGKQLLGAINAHPALQLNSADFALKPGVSGQSMICSNDPAFPVSGIVSPITYQNSKLYFYYNTLVKSYFVMQVSGSNVSYIDMVGGAVYNLDGTPQVQTAPVAVNASGDVTDLFLPYLNPDGYVRCVMKNKNNNNAYADFVNLETSFAVGADQATNSPAGINQLYSLDGTSTNVQVAQIPFPASASSMPDLSLATTYNVYSNPSASANPITYKVNSSYQSQSLQLMPIDMSTRAVVKQVPASQYNAARIIMKNNAINAVVFGGQFYANPQSAGSQSYTLSSGTNKIQVSMLVDSATNASYVAVVANGMTYNYQYAYNQLAPAQLQNYQQSVWNCRVVVSVTGSVMLIKNLAGAGLNSLQLKPATINNVVNPSALSNGSVVSGILQDAANNRFVVPVNASTYQYFAQSGYVDLYTGALFDANGYAIGYTLLITDLMALIAKLNFSVTYNSNNQAMLRYNAVSAVNTGIVPPSIANQPVQSVSQAGQQQSSQVSYQPAVLSSPVAVSAGSAVSGVNPQIASLQQANAQLQADLTGRQAALQKEKIASKRQLLMNQIKKDQDQINANNNQISVLQSGNAARSTLLGRLSSKHNKGKNKRK
ncbi:MAG: hypothetical protein ACXWL2_02015 [Candidatus Chromulinivorax sp.]